MINYYRDMYAKRSEVLVPLVRLTSNEVKWKWINKEQVVFEKAKKY